jgi:hypothetical protein
MKEDIRTQIAEIIHDAQDSYIVDKKHMPSQGIATNAILSIPLPTVKLKCDTCGGSGFLERYSGIGDQQFPNPQPCTCKGGEREYRWVWERECVIDCDNCCQPYFDGSKCNQDRTERKPLTHYDLADPDVAGAYWAINQRYGFDLSSIPQGSIISRMELSIPIPNNKGTLRLQEVER